MRWAWLRLVHGPYVVDTLSGGATTLRIVAMLLATIAKQTLPYSHFSSYNTLYELLTA